MLEANPVPFPGDSLQVQQRDQLRALDRVMAIAEFGTEGTLQGANANYLGLLGVTRIEALGRHHSSFCPPKWADSPQYQAFWDGLRAGKAQSGVVERIRSDGSSCWLEATYTPVINDQGEVLRILKIASDITDRRHHEREQKQRVHLLSLVSDACDTGVVISDSDSCIVYVNGGFTRMLGWTLEEIRGQRPIPLLGPNLSAKFTDEYRAGLRAGKSMGHEDILMGKVGQRCWVDVRSTPILDADGSWRYTITLLTDITRTKMYESLQHRVLEAMAREQPLTEVLQLVCLEVQRIAPEVTASILGVDREGLLHPLAAPSLPDSYSQMLDNLPIGAAVGSCGTAAWRNAPVLVDDIASDPLWQDFKHLVLPLGFHACWSTPIRNSKGQPIGTFAFYYRQPRSVASAEFHQQLVDVCAHLCALALEREHAQVRIQQLAFYDSLTSLPNRSLLKGKVDQAIATAARNGDQLAVLFIDLDRFKQVNDSLGHAAGDQLLCHVANHVQQVLRASDIAGRLSGDEFVVVLPQCDASHVVDTVARLQTAMAAPLVIGRTTLATTASIGIAMFPADGQDMEALLHCADMAMYQAKESRHGGYSFFSSEMNRLVHERLVLEAALRQSLQSGGLCLHYQPQIDLASGRLYGVEALARWTHAELGEVPPVRFIALAEECGLIAELGLWALSEACRQLADWRAQGLVVPAVSVNLSAASFHNLSLPQLVTSGLVRNGLQPRDLMLELTESILLDTNPSTMRTIDAIHALGVRISIDDFGTGYSSLSYLRRLPVSELKLDRSFVADLEHDKEAQALSSAILGIGKSLHLTVVAEGVETATQNAMLHAQGYDVAQGYLFAKPLAPDALARWVRESMGA